MEEPQRAFLNELLETATPAGFEHPGQAVWLSYVKPFADEVRTDAYGNAVATIHGDDRAVALTGHADEIGLMVRDIEDDGSIRMVRIGGSDRTISKGQHVTIHAEDGPIPGVIGQTAIHLRSSEDESIDDIEEQHIDIGVTSEAAAADLVERGDPITFSQRVVDLAGDRMVARGLDNRIGIWAAAEGLRRAAALEPNVTIHAISTVQEEVGLQGAKMVGFDLDADAVAVTDVTHATDAGDIPSDQTTGVEIGGGPVIARGSANHPSVVNAMRVAAKEADIEVQFEAAGNRTGTDADGFYTASGGIPSVSVSVPNRYMHTPVELISTADLDATATLLATFAATADQFTFQTEL